MKSKKHGLLIALVGIPLVLLFVACFAAVFMYFMSIRADIGPGLKKIGQQLSALSKLQSQLYKEYPSQNIAVKITNGYILQVNLFNSGYLNLPDESARQKKAKEIATFIVNNYEGIDTIDTITITFTERISLGLNLDKFSSYVFHVNDLK